MESSSVSYHCDCWDGGEPCCYCGDDDTPDGVESLCPVSTLEQCERDERGVGCKEYGRDD